MSNLHPEKIDTPVSLIKHACKGDSIAFGRIYELWSNNIYKYIYVKTRNEAVAEDITAEVFIKAWKAIKSFKLKGDVKFSTWLFAIARNSVIDYYRLTKQEISFDTIPEIADVFEGREELYPEHEQLKKALKNLKPEYRQVLELRYIEDIDISKVAQIIKKKEGNVRTLTSRALEALKKELLS